MSLSWTNRRFDKLLKRISGRDFVHTARRKPCSLKVHGGFCHLALTKLGQEHFVHSSLPTAGTDNGFLKVRSHGLLIDPDLPHLAIEFLPTLLALEVDFHFISFNYSSSC
jgi:hypothetical protein